MKQTRPIWNASVYKDEVQVEVIKITNGKENPEFLKI